MVLVAAVLTRFTLVRIEAAMAQFGPAEMLRKPDSQRLVRFLFKAELLSFFLTRT